MLVAPAEIFSQDMAIQAEVKQLRAHHGRKPGLRRSLTRMPAEAPLALMEARQYRLHEATLTASSSVHLPWLPEPQRSHVKQFCGAGFADSAQHSFPFTSSSISTSRVPTLDASTIKPEIFDLKSA